MTVEIRERLQNLSEEKYREFQQKLQPGTEHILGVRLPLLRKLAAEVARGDWGLYLAELEEMNSEDLFYEEIMMQGLVLGYARMSDEERVKYLNLFIPRITNWGICDSSISGFRFMRKTPEFWFSFLKQFRNSVNEFEIRFMIVSMMSHFMDQTHIDEILKICGEIRNNGYYAKMGNAWAVSVCYVKFPEKTKAFLKQGRLDDFTHNKAIQKMRESYRVSREEKEYLNSLKR